MENIKTFSFKRIFLLMQKTLYENARSVLIGFITVFGIFSLVLFMRIINGDNNINNLQTFYYTGFFISGFFISGMAFTNFRKKEKTMSYLMLPASIIEKFISEWLLTSVIFIILYSAAFYVFNIVLYSLGTIYKFNVEFVNILAAESFKMFLHFIIIQSVLLAGAATFKKAPLFLTISVVFGFGIIFIVYVTFLILIIKGQLETLVFNNSGLHSANVNINIQGHWLEKIPEIMYYYVTAPAFWAYTYFKIKEKEV